jgi:pilus assembly protein Flp/PilA
MKTLYSALVDDTAGATAVEYALMAGLIALAIVATVGLLGLSLDALFKNDDLTGALVGE